MAQGNTHDIERNGRREKNDAEAVRSRAIQAASSFGEYSTPDR